MLKIKSYLLNRKKFSSFFLISVFYIFSNISIQSKRKDIKSKEIAPDEYIQKCFKEYIVTCNSSQNYNQAARIYIATENLWFKELLNEITKYTALVIDEKTRISMQVFKGRGENMGHSFLNQVAYLLNLKTPLQKHFLFLDLLSSNGNKEKILKRQAEIRALSQNKKLIYVLKDLDDEAQEPFTKTLCYYSTQKGHTTQAYPYSYQENIEMFQLHVSRKFFGKGLSKVMERIFPKFFKKTKKNPYTAYLSRYLFIEADFLNIFKIINGTTLAARQLYNIWRVSGFRKSLKTIFSDYPTYNSLSPSSLGDTVFGIAPLSWLYKLPLLGSFVFKPFFLVLHGLTTFWFEMLPFNLLDYLERIWDYFMLMYRHRLILKDMTNQLFDLLPKIYESFALIKQVHGILKKNHLLKEEFQKEYKVLHQFLFDPKNKKIRKVLKEINKIIKRKNPMTVLEAWNMFSLFSSRLIYLYTRLEMVDEEQHEAFKKAIYLTAQFLYKANIARTISTSGQGSLPVCMPTIEETPHKNPIFEAKEAYTPLLINTKSINPIIKNDISIGSKNSTFIITGCNGGGKTTMLRAASGNMLLAPLGFICAQKGTFTIIGKIYYFANPEDSVAEGESLFMSEARYMGEVYQYVKNSTQPVMIFADEPFSKTGGIESRAILAALCIKLSDLPCPSVFMASTHLTDLDKLIKKMENQDFSFSKVEFIEGKGVTYRIIPGSVDEPLTNYILHEMKYEPDILLLQEKILLNDPDFKWKKKLRGYKPEKNIGKNLLLIILFFLLISLILFFKRRYNLSIRIERRKK